MKVELFFLFVCIVVINCQSTPFDDFADRLKPIALQRIFDQELCESKLEIFAKRSSYKTNEHDVKMFCDKATGMADFNIIEEIFLNLHQTTMPKCLASINDIENDTLSEGDQKQAFEAVLESQEKACEFIEENLVLAFCEAKQKCQDEESHKFLDKLLTGIQAFSQFLYDKRDAKFSCPTFKIKISPKLYETGDVRKFENNLLTTGLKCDENVPESTTTANFTLGDLFH